TTVTGGRARSASMLQVTESTPPPSGSTHSQSCSSSARETARRPAVMRPSSVRCPSRAPSSGARPPSTVTVTVRPPRPECPGGGGEHLLPQGRGGLDGGALQDQGPVAARPAGRWFPRVVRGAEAAWCLLHQYSSTTSGWLRVRPPCNAQRRGRAGADRCGG